MIAFTKARRTEEAEQRSRQERRGLLSKGFNAIKVNVTTTEEEGSVTKRNRMEEEETRKRRRKSGVKRLNALYTPTRSTLIKS